MKNEWLNCKCKYYNVYFYEHSVYNNIKNKHYTVMSKILLLWGIKLITVINEQMKGQYEQANR